MPATLLWLARGRWGFAVTERRQLDGGAYRGGAEPAFRPNAIPGRVKLALAANAFWAVTTLLVFVPCGMLLAWIAGTQFLELKSLFGIALSYIGGGFVSLLCLSGAGLSLSTVVASIHLARRNAAWADWCDHLGLWMLVHHGAVAVLVLGLCVFAPEALSLMALPMLGFVCSGIWCSAVGRSMRLTTDTEPPPGPPPATSPSRGIHEQAAQPVSDSVGGVDSPRDRKSSQL